MPESDVRTPFNDCDLESRLRDAWKRVTAEPGLKMYSSADEHISRALTVGFDMHLDGSGAIDYPLPVTNAGDVE